MPEKGLSLNAEQQAAVLHDQGPLLIVAGAGTGKTTVITERIAYLIKNKNCRPEEILALTFTDKAAGEMEERVDRLLPYGYVDLWIHTFHAFAEKVLHDHGLEIGLPNDFKLLSTTEQWLLVRQNLEKFPLDYYRPLGNPVKFIHALLKHFSRAKDENISPADYLNYVQELKLNADGAEFIKTIIDEETKKQLSKKELKEILAQEIAKQTEVAEAYHSYQQLLLANSALDFGDLINYALKLFTTRKNILLKYRNQFKYILVDEFQDTNYAQYELLKLLVGPQSNLTVVGDDDQSIYKFRGASISNILQFKDDYPQAKEIFLNQNYRSCQNILDLAYRFIKQNDPYRLEVKLAGARQLSKKLSAQKDGQGEIIHLHGRQLADEVKLVVEKIIKLYNNSQAVSWSDFAVLVRANSSADDFCYALEMAGVPFNFVASKGLYSKAVVLDLLAYLKLLDNYHEGPAMYRFLTLPVWQISQSDIVNLNYWAKRKGQSLYETLKQSAALNNFTPDFQRQIGQLLAVLEKHAQLVRENKKTTEIVQAFLGDTGYLKQLSATDSLASREQLGYLNQFYKKIQNFEQTSAHNSVKDFLSLVELELEAGEEGSLEVNLEEEGPDTVKIMTIHAAKGLEFKYVFISNLVDKRLPTIERKDPIELPDKLVKEIIPEGDIHLQEERRLMYVAMTRAKDGLYLTSAADYGGVRKKKLSRFLTELADLGLPLAAEIKAERVGDLSARRPALSDKTREKAPGFLPSKFSFTQLKAFESCPYQYRFAHVLKIPVKGKAQFSFGKSMHGTLQKFFLLLKTKQNKRQGDLFGAKDGSSVEASEAELLKIYQETFIDDWYASRKERDEYFAKGQRALKGFFALHQLNWPRVAALEQSFNFKIADGGVYTLYGFMDRLDEVEGGLRIVDYKTGQAKTKLSPEDKEQLLIYQLAAEKVLAEKVKELVFYYLDENKAVSFLGDDKELAALRKKIMAIIDEIKKGEFPPKPGEICKYCDFNGICEYRYK
ncbi:MAG: UvrD-helicase domain-containing protein [Patescibacteria group bacterium]